jgi:hypothetical protein
MQPVFHQNPSLYMYTKKAGFIAGILLYVLAFPGLSLINAFFADFSPKWDFRVYVIADLRWGGALALAFFNDLKKLGARSERALSASKTY